MNKKINFKPYYNEDNYSYDELPQFLVDVNEPKYQKTTFSAKLLYFYMYNKDISKLTKKTESDDNTFYFSLTNEEIKSYLDVSENTAKKYKNELVDAGLIIEKSSKGKNANRYAINKDLDLKKANSTYTDKEGNKRFTFYKIPHFLTHSYFNSNKQCDNFLYSIIRHRINLSISSAEKGKRDFVDNGGKVFCRFTINELLEKLNLRDKNIIKDARNRLIANGLLRESTTYNSNEKTSSIQYYVYEPIALPVETQKEDSKKKYALIYRASISANKVLLSKERFSKKKALGINKNDETYQNSNSNLSKINDNTPQNSTTRELELRELYFREHYNKHMKHMNEKSEANVTDVSYKNYNFKNDTKEKTTRAKSYPLALKAHILKYNVKDINSFCDVINKGKNNKNRELNTNYKIEEVERALIEAVQSTVAISEKEGKTQEEKEAYLMGAVKTVFQQHHDEDTKSEDKRNNNVPKRRNPISKEKTPEWLHKEEKTKNIGEDVKTQFLQELSYAIENKYKQELPEYLYNDLQVQWLQKEWNWENEKIDALSKDKKAFFEEQLAFAQDRLELKKKWMINDKEAI